MEKRQVLFSVILSEAISMNFDNNLSKATNYLNENGCPINYQTMRYYVGNFTLPEYSKAETILSILNYQISSDELLAILEYSSKQLFEKYTNKKYYNTSIRINPNTIEDGLSVEEFNTIIKRRCVELFDDESKGFTSYIVQLIINDLINNHIIKKRKGDLSAK